MKRKDYEKPTMKVVKLQYSMMLASSPGQAGVENYHWNNTDEE